MPVPQRLQDDSIPGKDTISTHGGQHLLTTAILYRFCIVLLGTLLLACSTSANFQQHSKTKIKNRWNALGFAKMHHTGISIYHVDKAKHIFGYNSDQLFTPASNTKILTMYAALNILDDSVAAAYYKIQHDSVIVWGGGDPGTAYPSIDKYSGFINWLRQVPGQVYFSNNHFRTKRYGAGWAWDDYSYSFQCEKTMLPIYGNQLWIQRQGENYFIVPTTLTSSVVVKQDTVTSLKRTEWGERFVYTYDRRKKEETLHAPITLLENDLVHIWSSAAHRYIESADIPFDTSSQIFFGSNTDSLLSLMMKESDNFVAEQLLLASSMKQLGYMHERALIDTFLQQQVPKLSPFIRWHDGSGLSRYNLASPNALVAILDTIFTHQQATYIREIFPAGGQSGTIRDFFMKGADHPYIFAKSGSLRDIYNLSGYLETRKGNWLIFSWMNNQLTEPILATKKKMEKFLQFLYEEY